MRTSNFILNFQQCFFIFFIFLGRVNRCQELMTETEEEEPEPVPNIASSECESSTNVYLNLLKTDPGIYNDLEGIPPRSKEGSLEEVQKYPNNFQVCGNKVCVPDNSETQRYTRWITVVDLTIIPSLLVISVVFLVLIFVHFWITRRSKLIGAMMLSTIATLASLYVFLSVIKFSGGNMANSHPTTCITLGFLVQFTNLSSFYWLNTICFEVWLKLRKVKFSRPFFGKKISLGFANPKFKWYAIYAWGIPLIVVSITILIQYLPDRLTVDLVMPSIGKGQCLFGTNKSTLLYLHIINAPVLFANLILFLSFVYNLCCGIWSKSTDMIERNHHATNLRTVIKIFFVMGLTWIAEIVSFILNWSFGPAKTYKYVVLFDVMNAMQGFTMFCVLFFDMDTIKMIKAKIGLKPASAAANKESTVRTFVSKVSFLTIPTSTSQISIVEETFPSSN